MLPENGAGPLGFTILGWISFFRSEACKIACLANTALPPPISIGFISTLYAFSLPTAKTKGLFRIVFSCWPLLKVRLG